jgi:flavin-dependent dehydrogenase
MAPRTPDVAVIGAGPAGSVFATRMAQLGFDVCLVERSTFPRRHLGESLSPGVLPMLASVGAAEAVEAAGFPRVHAVSTNWEGREAVRHDPRAEGMLVDRGVFDAVLLAQAAASGVRVLQPAQVVGQERTARGWRLRVDGRDGSLELHPQFVADAGGRSGSLSGRRRPMGRRTIAIHGYWTGPTLPDRPRIEAGVDAWYWGVPIPDGSYNTLVFVDGDRFRAEPGGSLEARLRTLLDGSSLMEGARGATLSGPVRAADATAYLGEDCVSSDHISVGDAGLAIDPLSSSGVQKAIQTALSGAIVANTLLRRPDSGAAARRFYLDSLRESAERHRAWAAGHYATAAAWRGGAFWVARAGEGYPAEAPGGAAPAAAIGDDVPVRLSAEAKWEERPCLGSEYVEIRPALRHPRLAGPVAYLGGHALAPLLRAAPSGMTTRQLADAWSGMLPRGTAVSIVRWLSGHGVLEPCTASPDR